MLMITDISKENHDDMKNQGINKGNKAIEKMITIMIVIISGVVNGGGG